MSDKTDETPPGHSGAGRILSGLAATAMLGAPVVAAATPTVADRTAGRSIQEQFSDAFTPGPLSDPVTDATGVIVVAPRLPNA